MEVALKSDFVCLVYLLVYITSEDDNIGWRMWVNYMWLMDQVKYLLSQLNSQVDKGMKDFYRPAV